MRYPVLAAVPVLCIPVALHAQVDTTAALRGFARSSTNGAPLAGVMISVPAARQFAVTDSTGEFWMIGLPTGSQLVRISYQGRQTEEYAFTLVSNRIKRINVILDVDAIDLAPIVVDAKAIRTFATFYDRKKLYRGFGTFFTREDIEQRMAKRISDMLRREGIQVRCNPECVPTKMYHGSLCVVPVIVNEMPFWDFDFDNIPIDDVVGIEVYQELTMPVALHPRNLTAPRDIMTPEPFRSRGSCGAIYIWMR